MSIVLTRGIRGRILIESAVRTDGRKQDMANTMTLTETTEMIETLCTEAASAGDSTVVEMCDRVLEASVELLDSETGERLTAEDLGIDSTRYVEACCESLDCGQAEGHVRVNGRRVYAA